MIVNMVLLGEVPLDDALIEELVDTVVLPALRVADSQQLIPGEAGATS